MAARSGLSQNAISRIWRAFALQPHRVETFKLSKDPLFIEKVGDIVGLYLRPPDQALVLCVDKKAQIQRSIARNRIADAAGPGGAPHARLHAARDDDALFAALNAKTGKVISEFHRRQLAREFRKFLQTVHAQVPASLDIHLIPDNSSTHKTAAIHRWLARHPRVHLHFTPTGFSWINLVERWFAALTEKQLRRCVRRSTRELETAIRRYVEITNGHAKPFVWTKTADEILASVARFCQRTSNSGH
jgi:transposase